MGFDLSNFNDPTLDPDYVTYLVEQEVVDAYLHFSRMWDYFRNPITPAAGLAAEALNTNSRPYFQAQEVGLPARITGIIRFGIGAEQVTNLSRKEVVIENDIAWRVHTMVDFLFGKPISIRSLARDPSLAERVEAVIKGLFEANNGQTFFHELALLGAVHGFVDILLRVPSDWFTAASRPATMTPPTQPAGRGPGPDESGSQASLPVPPTQGRSEAATEVDRKGLGRLQYKFAGEKAEHLARPLTLEIVDASRIVPILDENDFRSTRYWIQCFRKQTSQLDGGFRSFLSFGWGGRRDAQPKTVEVVEILGAYWWQRYEDRVLVDEGSNTLGRLPVVHIQNVSLPGNYEGLSDVEPLLPLQDELNTRLSDRASRVTFQSFKMYLAKGIDNFLERPVGPGQMWSTHNPDSSIQEFGHDSGSPSEDTHIDQIRQGMDKISGVTGLAAGLVRGHVGNLTSATALKVLLSGLLSRTERKRIAYGRGLADIIELVLALLDKANVLRTNVEDRRVEIHWPSPLPEDESQRLANAQTKASLGVPGDRILAELGYDRDSLPPAGRGGS